MKTLQENDLQQFYGTENWWRHEIVRDVLYTDGVRYVAETGEAFWLIDLIAIAQSLKRVKREEFQVWTLTVEANRGVIVADNGNGNPIYRQEIEYTDFPLPEIKMYFTGNVMMLPSEY